MYSRKLKVQAPKNIQSVDYKGTYAFTPLRIYEAEILDLFYQLRIYDDRGVLRLCYFDNGEYPENDMVIFADWIVVEEEGDTKLDKLIRKIKNYFSLIPTNIQKHPSAFEHFR